MSPGQLTLQNTLKWQMLMNFKVTSRFLKSKEQLIAVFYESKDATLFVSEKISHDESLKQKILYRLYDEDGLIHESHKGLFTNSEMEDPECFNIADCPFSLLTQADKSTFRSTIAHFSTKEDVLLFISTKCNKDPGPVSKQIFMIFKDNLLISTLNKNIIENKALREQSTGGTSQGASLSPLSQRPIPPGGPADFWVEPSEENE